MLISYMYEQTHNIYDNKYNIIRIEQAWRFK